MATIRDPAFWKRFSVAVHREEGRNQYNAATAPPLPMTSQSSASSSSAATFQPQALKQTDTNDSSWLERQQKKKSRRTCICWIFWLCFFGLVAGVVLVVLWMTTAGPLSKNKKSG